ncbi:PAS domain-containing protein [Methylopila musalis]|uniref:histidine kinase n=1 Tax=Methylopila musalis TaxID=1134781 RepID=A0ABW3ZBR1_9HYPH
MQPSARGYTGLLPPDDPTLPDPHRAMLDATPDCVKTLSVDGDLLTINRAGRIALDIPMDAELGMPFLPLVAEDLRAAGEAALRLAAAGETARFPGKSSATGVVRHWDNLLLPIVDASGAVLSIMCVSRDITEKVLLEQALEAAIRRETLIAEEMRHRIKNLFAVVSGLIALSEKEARAADAPGTATAVLQDKLKALSRASDAVFAQRGASGVDATDLEILIRSVLVPYGDSCRLVGGTVSVRGDSLTTLALFLHELATNSVKYGALSASGGAVTVVWSTSDAVLELRWIETGGPEIAAPTERNGFGGAMVDRLVRAAGGAIARSWLPEGLLIDLRLPTPA